MTTPEQGEPSTHSFIIRIWLEEPDQNNMSPAWYGQITLIATKEQHYFKNLNEMCNFIAVYLQSLNVDLGPGWRLTARLNQLKLNVKRFLGKIHIAFG